MYKALLKQTTPYTENVSFLCLTRFAKAAREALTLLLIIIILRCLETAYTLGVRRDGVSNAN